MDGAELLRDLLRQRGHGDDVVASAQAERRASHVAKPVALDELVSAIHRALDKER